MILPCVPPDLNNDQLQNDRKDLFPVFVRKDYARLQTNAASEMRALMDTAENEFLSEGGSWIGGEKSCGLADVRKFESRERLTGTFADWQWADPCDLDGVLGPEDVEDGRAAWARKHGFPQGP